MDFGLTLGTVSAVFSPLRIIFPERFREKKQTQHFLSASQNAFSPESLCVISLQAAQQGQPSTWLSECSARVSYSPLFHTVPQGSHVLPAPCPWLHISHHLHIPLPTSPCPHVPHPHVSISPCHPSVCSPPAPPPAPITSVPLPHWPNL